MPEETYSEIQVFTDGGARGNPGPAAIAVVVFDDQNRKIEETGKFIGNATNNIAEYLAILESLRLIKKFNFFRVVFNTDSSLVYNQLSGNWKVKKESLKQIVKEIKDELMDIPNFYINLIPREKNKDADRIVNEILNNLLK